MIDLKFLPLNKLANEHYNELNQLTFAKLLAVEDYFSELNRLSSQRRFPKSKVALAVNKFSKKSTQKLLLPNKTQFHTVGLYQDCLNIINILKSNFDITLKGTPQDIDNLVNTIKSEFLRHGTVKKKQFTYDSYFNHFLEGLKYVWDYGDFTQKQPNLFRYNAYQLAKKLSVNTCPYCNRSFTFTINIDNPIGKKIKVDEIARPEFDHFYSKARYPFLGISFYNLVPSCSLCNQTFKGDKEMTINTHCHPYVEGYEQVFNFTTGVTVKAFLSQRRPNVPIIFKQNPKADASHVSRAQATQSLFCIGQIYPYHSDIAEELFRRSTEDSKRLIESYWNQKSPNGKYLFPTKDDLYRHFVGNYYSTKDFIKRPLSKFYYDILKETRIISYIRSLPDRPLPSVSIPINK
ncbi:hypothetical protein INP83_11440 [Mucilaginibacter sp. 21P]|uniref:hypothetical protein n=1 Tax=Mucilaginibacter sp. 21P TaxID=2778902 RepID=UPI001C5A1A8F|nr:hypothetical protein [Mucilaginibacter sp. 21P]QXV63722.1 hypothetical protein INP83_11440 [Mucilaginibacter sp. 21P]